MTWIWLFDIDGTLLRAGGAGARSLDAVFLARYGLEGAMRGIEAGGRTDPWLVTQVFERRLGRAPEDGEVDAVIAAYLLVLARELETPGLLRVLPGVVEALDWLAGCAGAHAGIATGNVEAGARIKLDRAGLTARFAFGGYGCDCSRAAPAGSPHPIFGSFGPWSRPELVARAIDRGVARAGHVPRERIIVVGDTVHDVSAARACGVRVVAVATGSDTRATLEASGADVVLDSLAELPDWHYSLGAGSSGGGGSG